MRLGQGIRRIVYVEMREYRFLFHSRIAYRASNQTIVYDERQRYYSKEFKLRSPG